MLVHNYQPGFENHFFGNNFIAITLNFAIIFLFLIINLALNQHLSCLCCNADEQRPASLNEARILIILYLFRIAIVVPDGCGMS